MEEGRQIGGRCRCGGAPTCNVTPLDSRFLDNYRPVSTLPIFGKIYEKLIFKRVHSFLSANNIIYENQFGFRKNHSTSHAVNFAVNKVLWELENKNHIIGIFIDLSIRHLILFPMINCLIS